MRRLHVIFNPTAGRQANRRLTAVLDHLARLGCTMRLSRTAARGDAERLARDTDPAAYDLVVAAGGDGTINEIINGLAGKDLPLAIIPLGTANVLAAEIALDAAAPALAEAIAFGSPVPVFAGLANGRRFAVMVGVGFDARVVERLDRRVKRVLRKAAYVLYAAVALVTHRPRQYQIDIDGKPFTAAGILVAKGQRYAGCFVVAAEARIGVPLLQVALFRRPGRWNLLRYATALLFDRIARLPDVTILPAAAVQITGPSGEAVHADGDLVTCLPLSITVDDRVLSLIVPAGAAAIR